MGLAHISCFLQIEPGAKSRARAAQNQDALLRLIGSDFDRRDQIIE